MYDGKGRVIGPEQSVPKAVTAGGMAALGTGAGAYVVATVPIAKLWPGADKAIPAGAAAVGGAIGLSSTFNHAINRGYNMLRYPTGGFSPATDQSGESDMSAFARE